MATESSKPAKPASPVKNVYLILYNAISAALWLVVLVRTVTTLATDGPAAVHDATGEFLKWTQTLAGMEVLHALLGVVRAPVFTTGMQVASRYLLVWGVVHLFPELAVSPWYSSMVIAWSVTEVIRYSFFTFSLSGMLPGLLFWLRYNTFFVLYPIGISSECVMMYLALGPGKEFHPLYNYGIIAMLLIYVPGSYILYTHMMAQRRKVLKAQKVEKSK